MDKKVREKKFSAFCRKFLLAFIDVVLFFASNVALVYLTNGGQIEGIGYSNELLFNYTHAIITACGVIIINWAMGLYRSVWSFAGIDETVRCAVAAVLDTAFLFVVDRVIFPKFFSTINKIGFYAYLFEIVLVMFCIAFLRIGYRVIRRSLGEIDNKFIKRSTKKRVMIVGAGFMGNFVIEEMRKTDYKIGVPVCLIDDNPAKKGKRLNGVKIVGNCEQIPLIVKSRRIDTIIICVPSASKLRQREILDICLKTSAQVKISPSMTEFLESPNSGKKIRDVEISDLISRQEVKLDKKVCRYLIGETVLVLGGGGSIGSEICNQVARYNPKCIVIFDIYENCAFELQNELKNKYADIIDINVRIGSVRDIERIREVFREFRPGVVFHAAAHKHVPLMEDSPCEAVKNNVLGTYNVACVSAEFKAKKMVILSTDKAVNPTNVMGATKRITEIIIQYMNQKYPETVFAAVRFGNVLGSHGSVVPIFKQMIAQGGPVCVTHPDITRYFMTIPEAAQLVCQAGGLAKGGEVFVLDMGEPVKIMDLAKNLIKLSGFEVDEIGIKIVGLRPGEKLYEELAMESEISTRKKTSNNKIFVTMPEEISDESFNEMLEKLNTVNSDNVREVLKSIVPNYHPAEN